MADHKAGKKHQKMQAQKKRKQKEHTIQPSRRLTAAQKVSIFLWIKCKKEKQAQRRAAADRSRNQRPGRIKNQGLYFPT